MGIRLVEVLLLFGNPWAKQLLDVKEQLETQHFGNYYMYRVITKAKRHDEQVELEVEFCR